MVDLREDVMWRFGLATVTGKQVSDGLGGERQTVVTRRRCGGGGSWTYAVVVAIVKNIAHLISCSRKRAPAGKGLAGNLAVSFVWVATKRIGKTDSAGFCVIGGVTGRLFAIGEGPIAFAFALALTLCIPGGGGMVGDRRGLSGRDDDRG